MNPKPAIRALSSVRWAWLAACLLVAAWFGFGRSADDGSPQLVRSPASQAIDGGFSTSSRLTSQLSAQSPQPMSSGINLRTPHRLLLTRPIETIRVGQRVVAENPELAAQRVPEAVVDPETTRLVVLHQVKPDGDELTVEMLLPLEVLLTAVLERLASEESLAVEPLPLVGLLEDVVLHELLVGQLFELNLPELGAAGPAEIVAVRACPGLEPNDGTSRRLVTSVFRHTAANVVDLTTTGSDEPIGTTDNHPFWSEDRQGFVPAGELRAGERLRSASGSLVEVKCITPRGGPRTAVFNFEVEGQHVYSVGSDGLLVHNDCHHPIPKFMGGDGLGQAMVELQKKVHDELHALMRENLRLRGINMHIGGIGGSIKDWLRYMLKNPGTQRQAFDSALDASRTIDAKYGTEIVQSFWNNIYNGKFISLQ